AVDRRAAPAKPGWLLAGYRAATRVAAPAAPLLLQYRERHGKEESGRRGERFGKTAMPRPEGTLVWFHAASVGETNMLLPLIDTLRPVRPDVRVLLTTMTVTSAALAGRRLSPADVHQYVPLDVPRFVRRFLDHWKPALAVFAESEIWPNLILETAARGVPLALVNARISDRSYARWRRHRRVAESLLGRFDAVLAQNETLARRFRELGARAVEAVGNLKIDAPPPPVDAAAFQALQRALGGRPVLVAASTHEGEERIVAAAHRQLAQRLDGFCSIVVPRHPERGTAIAELLTQLGLSIRQRSLGGLPERACDVYIADTIGELGTFYALAPVAFIGGSLVPHGGQNPIEAVRSGAAVLTGPHWHNFQDAYRSLFEHDGAVRIHDADGLAAAVLRLLADDSALRAARQGAEAALATMSGALRRTTESLLRLLP
ncbi:MAG: 3-deoxy-D-manno-octulosonic acid transferase, partial [Hyphomicrobiaceae bacterium]